MIVTMYEDAKTNAGRPWVVKTWDGTFASFERFNQRADAEKKYRQLRGEAS